LRPAEETKTTSTSRLGEHTACARQGALTGDSPTSFVIHVGVVFIIIDDVSRTLLGHDAHIIESQTQTILCRVGCSRYCANAHSMLREIRERPHGALSVSTRSHGLGRDDDSKSSSERGRTAYDVEVAYMRVRLRSEGLSRGAVRALVRWAVGALTCARRAV